VINVSDFRLKLKQEFSDTVIGDRVTIGEFIFSPFESIWILIPLVGHGAFLSGCTIKDESIVDMGAVVNEGAVVGQNSVVAAGSVVAPGEQIPSGQVRSIAIL
jgi:acetyltransferase-like isoleucine patch superfamily enzyme